MSRPRGLAAGTGYLLFAWFAGLGLARLTGAVAVVIVLGAGLVLALGALVAGWSRLRTVREVEVSVGRRVVDAGRPVRAEVRGVAGGAGSAHLTVRTDDGRVLGSAWATGAVTELELVFPARGRVEAVEVVVDGAGLPGWAWWRRTLRAPLVAPLLVAPPPAGPGARVLTRSASLGDDEMSTMRRSTGGDVDGIRPWREGDADRAVHWPTSMRVGSLVVHDHRPDDHLVRIIRADPGATDRSLEMGRVRWAAREGLREGATVLVAVGDGDPVAIADDEAAAQWTAIGLPDPALPRDRSWWPRPIEPTAALSARARWAVAAAAAAALAMLTSALAVPTIALVAMVVGCVVGAMLTAGDAQRHRWARVVMRVVVVLIALGGMVTILRTVGDLTTLLAVIRGPLPELLMLLVVLHGFECTSRRAARASLAFSSVVAVQAASLRVDQQLGLWLAAWGAIWMLAFVLVGARPQRAPRGGTPWHRSARTSLALTAGALATVVLLSQVDVPDGPANLGLPASFETVRPVDQPGQISDVTGATSQAGTATPDRSGSAAYPGFSASLDTSVRGPLGDELVMVVRAPQPDFWKGQTFSRFDGRFWYADDDPGFVTPGPDVPIGPAQGDLPTPAVETEAFVQTYYLAMDLPNVVFAAYRPERVIIDGALWARPDGSLRSGQVMTDGAVYTVVSKRPLVTEASLRAEGDVRDRIAGTGDAGLLARYLEVPASTTDRTVQLADQLASGATTTYDLIRAMERWLGDHVEYDLDAPVPARGTDAVDDFLFSSRRGFCEQIASALAVMLRTQGVPARLATGFVPGTRDRVSGVWKVSASDAHAWVEVWFPGIGWQTFDPTASVPLAGEQQRASVGGDLLRAARDTLDRHGRAIALTLAVLLAFAVVVGGGSRVVRRWRHRRRRGRWGVLQDRFRSASIARGLDVSGSNPAIARQWAEIDPDLAVPAALLATALDRAAFDPTWVDDDRSYVDADALAARVR